jgi:hypothetical protein
MTRKPVKKKRPPPKLWIDELDPVLARRMTAMPPWCRVRVEVILKRYFSLPGRENPARRDVIFLFALMRALVGRRPPS